MQRKLRRLTLSALAATLCLGPLAATLPAHADDHNIFRHNILPLSFYISLLFSHFNRPEFTKLCAQSASVAHGSVDLYRAVFLLCQGRTAGLKACAALFTFLRNRHAFIRELLSF